MDPTVQAIANYIAYYEGLTDTPPDLRALFEREHGHISDEVWAAGEAAATIGASNLQILNYSRTDRYLRNFLVLSQPGQQTVTIRLRVLVDVLDSQNNVISQEYRMLNIPDVSINQRIADLYNYIEYRLDLWIVEKRYERVEDWDIIPGIYF